MSVTAALQIARIRGEDFPVFLADRVGHDQQVLLDRRAGILVAVRLEPALKRMGLNANPASMVSEVDFLP